MKIGDLFFKIIIRNIQFLYELIQPKVILIALWNALFDYTIIAFHCS